MLEKYIREKLESRPLLLMTHAVVGYPSLEDNRKMLVSMQEAGIDLVELQLPFSEPVADGPAFIHANQSALENGVHWQQYFDFFSSVAADSDFPLLFMGYYNSVFCMRHEVFCDRLKAAGGAGFIIADLPVELSSGLDDYAGAQGLDHIQTMTPVNSEQRLRQIAAAASGFVYCVSRKGVTGLETDFNRDLHEYIRRCRQATDLPLALGFGIRTAEQVRQMRGLADIAIVGTACLQVWEQQGPEQFRRFLHDLVAAARS